MISKLRPHLAILLLIVTALALTVSPRKAPAGTTTSGALTRTASELSSSHVAWSVRGANIQSTSPTYLESTDFFSAVRALRATGANSVKLIVQVYQWSFTSSSVFAGSLTPTDTALARGIAYARSQHLQVSVSIHDDLVNPKSLPGMWRGWINPLGVARTHWFGSYALTLLHYARIAFNSHAWSYSLGTEMLDMTGTADAPHWISIIKRIRSADPGLRLLYEADQNDLYWRARHHGKQGDSMAFDKYLNFMGISSYVPLTTVDDPNFTFAKAAIRLQQWFTLEVAPLIRRFGSRVIITEAGYSSAPNTLMEPAAYLGSSTSYDQTSQLRGYQALLALLAHQPGIVGMFLWEWGPTGGSGGPNDANFTPQAKLAEGLIRFYWGAAALVVPMPSSNNDGDGIYTLRARISGWPIGSYVMRYSVGGSPSRPMYPVSSGLAHYEANIDLSQAAVGEQQVTFSMYDPTGHYLGSAQQALQVSTPVQQPSFVDSWWPKANQSPLYDPQTFKGRINDMDVNDYTMYWQIDGGAPVPMAITPDDVTGPYFSNGVDVDNFTWRGHGPYLINFMARGLDGAVIGMSSPIAVTTG